MYYYQHHIGDFNRDTRHLTRIERSIYRDLIELYYETETQLSHDIAFICRRVLAKSNEEATAVEQVLNEFFTKTPDGWWHDNCEEGIEACRSSTTQKSLAGKASAAKREAKRQQALNGNSTGVERALNGTPTTQYPLPSTHNPIPKVKTPAAPEYSDEFLEAWAKYPSRPGANKKQAYKAWAARLKAGADPIAMIAGCVSYSLYCEATNTAGNFIKQPDTFFGPAEHYLTDWAISAATIRAGPTTKEESRAAAARAFMPQTQGPRHDHRTIDITPPATAELGFENFHEDAGLVREPLG